jgi:hypothetical protein
VVFTNIFGGANGNEGLGFLSLCFDFQYIGSSALYLPLKVSLLSHIFQCQLIIDRLNSTLLSDTYLTWPSSWVYSTATSGEPETSHFSPSYCSPRLQIQAATLPSTKLLFWMQMEVLMRACLQLKEVHRTWQQHLLLTF